MNCNKLVSNTAEHSSNSGNDDTLRDATLVLEVRETLTSELIQIDLKQITAQYVFSGVSEKA